MEITPDPEALYAAYASMLYGYILQQTQDSKAADKLLVATFVYAFSHLHEYDQTKSSQFSWLIRIANRQMALLVK